MKKIILLVVAVAMLSGCATLGVDTGSVGRQIEAAETDLVETEKVVEALHSIGGIDEKQVLEVSGVIGEARQLLESAKAAQSINNKIESERYVEALVELMAKLEKYGQEK